MASGTVFPTPHRGVPWIRLVLALLLALGALAAQFPAYASAKSIEVKNTNDSGTGSLRQAIMDADPGDTINFNLPGNGPWTINLAGTLPTINKALTIQGPGYTKLTIQGNNTFRLLFINATGETVKLSGLTLKQGKATGSYGGNIRSVGGNLSLNNVALRDATAGDDQGGAGAFLSNGTYSLNNVFVTGNTAPGSAKHGTGAGLHISELYGDTSVKITSSVIADNVGASYHGAGVMISRTSGVVGRILSVEFDSSVVNNNTQKPGIGIPGNGAGIFNEQGTLTLNDSQVGGNTASDFGGGIFNSDGTLTLNGSTIINNSAIHGGGGIEIYHGTAMLNNSTISGNTAFNYGGGIENDDATLTMIGVTLSGNKAYGAGGLFNLGTATLVNVTISGNSADNGGGILNGGSSSLELVFVTIVGNTATTQGGGIYAVPGASPTVTKLGSVINIGNSSPSKPDCAGSDPSKVTITSSGYNVFGIGTDCPTNGTGDTTALTADSVLKMTLADNGGPTKTHGLVFGSPAINRMPCVNTIDQRGASRPFGGNCDSGAYEAHAFGDVTLSLVNGDSMGRSPIGTGSGGFIYNPGTVVKLTPGVNKFGQMFVGWKVDGVYKGWANPLTITMNADYTVEAIYATVTLFPDVPEGRADAYAINMLAARGTIRGYQNGNFGPDDGVTRAQMAALIARATTAGLPDPAHTLTPPACSVTGTWDCEDWGTNFTDQEGVTGSLWRSAGTLAHYGVASGYGAAACANMGKASPCFGPNDSVSYAQTISFITRAMVAKGYWKSQPGALYPYAGVPAAHSADVATFFYYTTNIPVVPSDWNAPATRGWFAQMLWEALNSYWGKDGTLSGGFPTGGYVP